MTVYVVYAVWVTRVVPYDEFLHVVDSKDKALELTHRFNRQYPKEMATAYFTVKELKITVSGLEI